MDEERSILPWVIFLSALVLVAVVVVWQFSPTPEGRYQEATRHPLTGKWRSSAIGTLIVYEDRWAAANGIKCPWEPAGGSAIRIELDLEKVWASLPSVTVMADFRLLPANGGRQAVLNLLGKDQVFERMEDGATTERPALP